MTVIYHEYIADTVINIILYYIVHLFNIMSYKLFNIKTINYC